MVPAVSREVSCLRSPILLLPDGSWIAILRHMNPVASAACLTALVVSTLASGCGAPAIEGVFNDRAFSIANEQPERRGGGATLVFAEADDEAGVLRTVSLTLSSTSLTVGALALGEDVRVDAVEGTLVRVPLDNGTGKVLLTSGGDTTIAHASGGEVVVDDVSDAGISGSFSADLDDGGHLDGWFRTAP
jgi:hypothetical protein